VPNHPLSPETTEARLRRLLLEKYYPLPSHERARVAGMPIIPRRPLSGLQKPYSESTLPEWMKILGEYGKAVQDKSYGFSNKRLWNRQVLGRLDDAYREDRKRALGLDVAKKERADAPTFLDPQRSSPYGGVHLPRLHQPSGEGESLEETERKRSYWTDRVAKITSGEMLDPEVAQQGLSSGAGRMVDMMLQDSARYHKLMKLGEKAVGKHEDKLHQFLSGEQFEKDMKPQRVESAEYEIHQGDKVLGMFIPQTNTPAQVARMAQRLGGQAVLRQGETMYPIAPDGLLLSPRPYGEPL